MKLSGYSDVNVYEHELENGAKIAILFGGLYKPNPKEYMDNAVFSYVGDRMFNEYIEETMDNPWLRVIIFNLNNLPHLIND